MNRSDRPQGNEPLDLERVIYDPEYRGFVRDFLNGKRSNPEDPAPWSECLGPDSAD